MPYLDPSTEGHSVIPSFAMALLLPSTTVSTAISTLALASLLIVIGLAVNQLLRKRPFPSSAPPRIKHYPLVGSLAFFGDRAKFLRNGRNANATGQCSFYFGSHPIVSLSGDGPRSFYYNSRELDLTAGYGLLGPRSISSLAFHTRLLLMARADSDNL
jgi:hypothetical protein